MAKYGYNGAIISPWISINKWSSKGYWYLIMAKYGYDGAIISLWISINKWDGISENVKAFASQLMATMTKIDISNNDKDRYWQQW